MKKRADYSAIITMIVMIVMLFWPVISAAFENASLPAWLTNDYARIVDMDYKAVVVDEPGSQGKIVVTERITFDVHAASRSNGFWELWRDLCEDTIDGVKVHYKVNSVKQIMPDGREVVWPESPELYWDDYDYVSSNTRLGPGKWYHSEGPYSEYLEQYECVFFYVDNLYRERVTFEIEYEMYNAVLRYGDCADLYIAMYSGDTTKYLENFSAEILIPNKDMPSVGNYKVMTYGTNANSFPIKESSSKNPGYHTFSFELTEDDLKFRPYNEYIEFDLVSYGDDKHAFADYASKGYYYDDPVLDEIWDEQAVYAAEPAQAKSTKTTVLFACVLIAAVVLFVGMQKISKLKRKYPFYTSDQTLETFRDVPSDLDPNFASELVFCKDKKKKEDEGGVYSALLLSLARKKYVELQEIPGGDVYITVLDEPPREEPVDTTLEFDGFPTLNIAPVIDEEPAVNDPNESNEYIYKAMLDSAKPDEPATIDETYDANAHSEFNTSFGAEQPAEPVESDDPLKAFFTSGPIDASQAYGSFAGQDLFETSARQETSVQPEETVASGFNVAYDTREPLTLCEKAYLDLVKRHAPGGTVGMGQLQRLISTDFGYMNNFVDSMQMSIVNIGVNEGYFQKADWKEPKKKLASSAKSSLIWGVIISMLFNIISYNTRLDLAFGGFFILGIACIINGLYLKSQSHKYVLLTEYGEEEYTKWRGLYNFLKSDTLMNERTVVELPLWEKYLVYATAFGISEKVIEAIKIRCPEAMNTTESKSIVHSTYTRSGRIRTSGRRFHSSVRSGYHGGFSGGGGGGGFGYGGGGRGGGGGGGGH